MPTDAELLQSHLRGNAPRAFADLVARHIPLVYGAALRRTSGRRDLAEEIAQRVFTDLARKAPRLGNHPSLAGWLHQATRYATIDALREESRRMKLARTYAAAAEGEAGTPPDWELLRPVLDEALDQLKPEDRDAVLLRFFQGLSHAEVGVHLGLNENAARMRAERALGKLREHLGRRGVNSTVAALGLALANQPVVAAPAGLAATIALNAATVPVAGVLTVLFMNKAAYVVLSVVLAGGFGFGWWAVTTANRAPGAVATPSASSAAQQAAAAGRAVAAARSAEALRAEGLEQKLEQHRAIRTEAKATPIAKPVGQHSDRGQDTPRDAIMSLAWAQDASETDALAKLICFDETGGKYARELWAGLPTDLRAELSTPEQLYALVLAADALKAPPPPPEVLEKFTVVPRSADEVELTMPGDTSGGMFRFRRTEEGWKWILPIQAVQDLPNQVMKSKPSEPPVRSE